MSQTLIRKTREFSAVTLVLSAFIILSFAFVQRSRSAMPTAGTINPGGPAISWVGTAPGGSSPEGEDTCVEGVNCDTFLLTLSGQPADWAGKKARIAISVMLEPAVTDYDVVVHKGATNAGPIVGTAADGGTPPEVIELDPSIPSVGTGVFSVRVIYFAATSADQYRGDVTVIAGAAPTPTPSPGATPTPTPIPPGAPRFVNHYAPPGVMEDAAEPTMGVNWRTENNPRGIATAFKNKFRSGAENQTFNGGTSLYYGGVNDFFLRATFDDCASPAIVQWDQIDLTIANAPRAGYDPLLYTDHWTGRTFVLQEFALTPAGSSMEFTDNDGDQMFIAQGGGPSGIDHQTVGGGPLRADPVTGATPPNTVTPMIPAAGGTPIPNPTATPYPHGVYYASQSIATATSQRSTDGGFSYPQQIPMYTASDCAGLHGHIKIAEDGTAFVPDKACSPAGVPFLFGGNPAVVVSEDNGASWQVRRVPNAESDAGVDDPSVGVSWCPAGIAARQRRRSAASISTWASCMPMVARVSPIRTTKAWPGSVWLTSVPSRTSSTSPSRQWLWGIQAARHSPSSAPRRRGPMARMRPQHSPASGTCTSRRPSTSVRRGISRTSAAMTRSSVAASAATAPAETSSTSSISRSTSRGACLWPAKTAASAAV
jgi:hypothetical protein